MYSQGSDYGYRRHDGDRNSRQKWDDYDDRREDRHDFYSNTPRASYYKYSSDGHSGTTRVSKGQDYSESPKTLCSSDSVSREWSRMSPVRRHLSPPDWDAPEVKRRRQTEEDDTDYRYKRDSPEKAHRLSPVSFSRNQQLGYSPSHEDDARYRKMSPYSRSRNHSDNLSHKYQYGDFFERDSSDRFEGSAYQNRRTGYSLERTLSPDDTTQIQAKRRERIPNPSASGYYDEYYESRTTVPLNGSSGQSSKSDAPPQRAAVPDDKSSKGFQRFLEVLNKGVNVDVLTQIVSQNPAPQCDGPILPRSFVKVADQQWSPSCTERQQKSYKDNSYWNESKGSLRSTSPLPHHQSASPDRNVVSVGSKSPSVEKTSMTAEDEQKRKQMQDVLQAIGVDLGFEELGQMSHRIQERLYGKRDNERGRRLSKEKGVGQTFTEGRRSRSSSSSSSFSPPRQHFYTRRDSLSNPRDEADLQRPERNLEIKRRTFQDGQSSEESKISTVKSIPVLNVTSKPIPAARQPSSALMPPIPPTPPRLPYSPITHPPPSYPTVPPPPLPFPPPAGPGSFLPNVPPMLPHAPFPSPNVFPPLLPQVIPPFPPNLQLCHPTNAKAQPAMKTKQISRTQGRPRFLQVIK